VAQAKYSRALDGVRFFAVAIVFLFHAYEFTPSVAHVPFVQFGWLGVPIFFVLSGFLIGGILLDLRDRLDRRELSRGTALRLFYLRRFIRLFPAYYLVLIVLVVVRSLGVEPGQPEKSFPLVWHFLYLTNVKQFIEGAWGGAESHFWSLSVEEHFYVLAPLMMLTVSRKRLALLSIIIGGLSLAAVYILPFCGTARWYWILSPWHFAPLCMGIAAAIAEREGAILGLSRNGLKRVGAVGGALVVFLVVNRTTGLPFKALATDYPFHDLVTTATAMATAALVVSLWRGELGIVNRALSVKPVAYLGKISYGLYLFHPYCLRWLPECFGARWTLPGGLSAFVLTVATAILSWHVLEAPLNRLKPEYPLRARSPS
jgi:peptidoglycan/LPS O-acetylase OafA/YrhL